MGDLIYSFSSLAERIIDGTASIEGMELLAGIFHKYGIPVTWHVSPESAQLASEQLTRWHDSHGDAVTMALPTNASGDSNSRAPQFAASRSEKAALIEARRDAIRKALPWADLTLASAGHTDPDAAGILEELGFEGLWGYCPEQIEVDDITDRGCPWGCFYIDPAQRLRPKPSGRGVAGLEWTARDLGKSMLCGNPTIYSTDPNDVARASICRWDDINYWINLANAYLFNAGFNEQIFLLQHQEAHEMQVQPFHCYTREDVNESARMLDSFAGYMSSMAKVKSLPDAVRAYRAKNSQTAPSYIFWQDIHCPKPNPDYSWNTPSGPWPTSFLTYDTDAMMLFIEGKSEPHILRNYALDPKTNEYFNEKSIPHARLVCNQQFHWRREITLHVNSPRSMPYGLALWGDYSLYQIRDREGIADWKIIPGELLYLRVNLHEGENLIKVKLDGK